MDELVRHPHQRVGAESNAHVGRDFEEVARRFFADRGVELARDFAVQAGLEFTKERKFDLGSLEHRVLVECKSHRWTEGHRVPSAKITVWNEAMYYFLLAPAHFQKFLFVLHHRRGGDGESLADYYVRTYGHLIPPGVRILEWNEDSHTVVGDDGLAL